MRNLLVVLFLAVAHLGFVSLSPRRIKYLWKQGLSHPRKRFFCLCHFLMSLLLSHACSVGLFFPTFTCWLVLSYFCMLACSFLLSHVTLFNYSFLLLFNCSLFFFIVALLLLHVALLHSSILHFPSPLISLFLDFRFVFAKYYPLAFCYR